MTSMKEQHAHEMMALALEIHDMREAIKAKKRRMFELRGIVMALDAVEKSKDKKPQKQNSE